MHTHLRVTHLGALDLSLQNCRHYNRGSPKDTVVCVCVCVCVGVCVRAFHDTGICSILAFALYRAFTGYSCECYLHLNLLQTTWNLSWK